MTKSEEQRINDHIKKMLNKAKWSKKRYIELYSSMPPKFDNKIISPTFLIRYCTSNGLMYGFYDDMNKLIKRNTVIRKWSDFHHMVIYL